MPEIWATQLDETIHEIFPWIVEIRRHLHSHPEPSGEERETTRYLAERLNQAGLSVQVAPTGRGLIVDPSAEVVARLADSPRIAIRGDIDALRIQDAKNVPYCSQVPGVMHACGHDGHTAAVVGALMGLQAMSAAGAFPWDVSWRGILQPAEETNTGALEMIAAGGIADVQAILSLHLDPTRQVGRVGLRPGVLTAACDDLQIRIVGRGGHAARPHESLDPIAAAAQLISTLYLFVPRATDSHDPVVVTIGQIHGGNSPNVIPEEVMLHGTVRTFGEAVRTRTKDQIQKLARGIADVSDTQIEVTFGLGPESVHNDPALNELFREAARTILGNTAIDDIARPSMGGEDFAHYTDRIPGCMFRLGCAPTAEPSPRLHSPSFDIDEQSLLIGAKMLAHTVVLWSRPPR